MLKRAALLLVAGTHLGAFTLATIGQVTFHGLPPPTSQLHSFPTGVSADGSIIVGGATTSGLTFPCYWTIGGAASALPLFSFATSGIARAASGDGSVIVGFEQAHAFRWTASQGIASIGMLPGHSWADANGISADATTIVGYSGVGSDRRAFRWIDGQGMESLGLLPGASVSSAKGVSADGSVIVGWSGPTSASGRPFRWAASTGMVEIPVPPGTTDATATAVSGDGAVVVGTLTPGGPRAWRWTEQVGLVDIGPGEALAVSGDGSVVVGGNGAQPGWLWTSQSGRIEIPTALAQAGINLTGWSIYQAFGVSADGSVIVGSGTYGGVSHTWVVTGLVPAPGAATLGLLGLIGATARRRRGSLCGNPGRTSPATLESDPASAG